MKVEATPRATLLTLEPQTVDIPAGEAREVAWNVTAPAQLAQTRAEAILWEIEAKDTLGGARDALKVRQRIVPGRAAHGAAGHAGAGRRRLHARRRRRRPTPCPAAAA